MNWPAMRNSHAVRVCIILLMFHQRLSWRYWMLFKRSADIIIKGHHELAGCAVWKLQAKETDGLWRRRRKAIFKVNTATQVRCVAAFTAHYETTNSLLHKNAQRMHQYKRKSWKWCYSQNTNMIMIMCSFDTQKYPWLILKSVSLIEAFSAPRKKQKKTSGIVEYILKLTLHGVYF